MIQFKKMLEVFTRNGILANHKDTRKPYYLGPNELKYQQFLENLDHCQHFVFTPQKGPVEDVEHEHVPDSLDLPFKAISIEVLGDVAITMSRPSDPMSVDTRCIYIIERAPKDYLVFAYVETPTANEVFLVASPGNHYLFIIQDYLERLRLEKEGVQTVRERIKVGTGKVKRTHTIRRIIYVTPKQGIESLSQKISKPIDWTQRWLVRGHWRKQEGLGKDREGNYCIPGHTWVTEHVKGPESAPLIQKTRLVKN